MKLNKKPLLVASFLATPNSKTNSLISEARHISQINIIVKQLLDHQLADHVHASSVKNGQLTLIVDSPVWATRLRYIHSEIINGLKKFTISNNINYITVKVRPLSFRQQTKKSVTRKLSISLSSASKIQKELETMPESSLKATLKRILRHAK